MSKKLPLTIAASDIKKAGGLAAFLERLSLNQGVFKPERSEKPPAEAKKKIRLPGKGPLEDDEQEALVSWAQRLETKYPELALLFHIPNGGARHRAVAAKLRAQGVKKGVPDLFLPVRRAPYAGLWIEMKRKDGGTATIEQKKWLEALSGQGFRVALCHGFESAVREIVNYLGLPEGLRD